MSGAKHSKECNLVTKILICRPPCCSCFLRQRPGARANNAPRGDRTLTVEGTQSNVSGTTICIPVCVCPHSIQSELLKDQLSSHMSSSDRELKQHWFCRQSTISTSWTVLSLKFGPALSYTAGRPRHQQAGSIFAEAVGPCCKCSSGESCRHTTE